MQPEPPTGPVREIYARRFGEETAFRAAMWEVLCRDFFQRRVDPGSTVLELGAGYCEFINHIRAARRIAVDINPDVRARAAAGVEVVQSSSEDLSAIADASVDLAFASNFFEHLSRPSILQTLKEAARVVRPGGRIMVLQPNIRFCFRDYWRFFDHVTPLDDRSLGEALEMSGFQVTEVIVRFLPYTTKGRLPRLLLLLRLYLRLPPFWRVFGQQSLLVGVRPTTSR